MVVCVCAQANDAQRKNVGDNNDACIYTTSIDSAAAVAFVLQFASRASSNSSGSSRRIKRAKERRGKCACNVMKMMGVMDFSWR